MLPPLPLPAKVRQRQPPAARRCMQCGGSGNQKLLNGLKRHLSTATMTMKSRRMKGRAAQEPGTACGFTMQHSGSGSIQQCPAVASGGVSRYAGAPAFVRALRAWWMPQPVWTAQLGFNGYMNPCAGGCK